MNKLNKNIPTTALGLDILFSLGILIAYLSFRAHGLRFDNPRSLYFLLLLIPSYYFFFSNYQKLNKTYYEANSIIGFSGQLTRFAVKFLALKFCFIGVILALSDPVLGFEKKDLPSKGSDIMVCLDLSRSMDVKDIEDKSRLESAKNVLKALANKLTGQRIGLCVFAENSIIQLPLTRDYDRFKIMVSEVNTSYFSNQGTNISSAVDNARNSLNRNGQQHVILLLTDGENHQETQDTFIDALTKSNIKLIATAIGSESGGPVLEGDNKKIRLDAEGNVILSKVNLSLVKSLAEKSRGIWFHFTEPYPSPDPILTEINLNASRDLRNLDWKIVRRLFSAPLIMALFAFMLYILAPPFIPKQR